jgi:hypothetical protein
MSDEKKSRNPLEMLLRLGIAALLLAYAGGWALDNYTSPTRTTQEMRDKAKAVVIDALRDTQAKSWR